MHTRARYWIGMDVWPRICNIPEANRPIQVVNTFIFYSNHENRTQRLLLLVFQIFNIFFFLLGISILFGNFRCSFSRTGPVFLSHIIGSPHRAQATFNITRFSLSLWVRHIYYVQQSFSQSGFQRTPMLNQLRWCNCAFVANIVCAAVDLCSQRGTRICLVWAFPCTDSEENCRRRVWHCHISVIDLVCVLDLLIEWCKLNAMSNEHPVNSVNLLMFDMAQINHIIYAGRRSP